MGLQNAQGTNTPASQKWKNSPATTGNKISPPSLRFPVRQPFLASSFQRGGEGQTGMITSSSFLFSAIGRNAKPPWFSCEDAK